MNFEYPVCSHERQVTELFLPYILQWLLIVRTKRQIASSRAHKEENGRVSVVETKYSDITVLFWSLRCVVGCSVHCEYV